jgi:hypothetical protein
MVISQEIIERLMEYRGYKSVRYKNLAVKEQRVNGSYNGLINNPMLRCTLKGFERNYQTGIPYKYINTYKYFSSRPGRAYVSYTNLRNNPKLCFARRSTHLLVGSPKGGSHHPPELCTRPFQLG